MADLVEIDNRAETGKITKPITGETDEEVSAKISEETRMRQEELALKLKETREEQQQTEVDNAS